MERLLWLTTHMMTDQPCMYYLCHLLVYRFSISHIFPAKHRAHETFQCRMIIAYLPAINTLLLKASLTPPLFSHILQASSLVFVGIFFTFHSFYAIVPSRHPIIPEQAKKVILIIRRYPQIK